MDSACIRHCDIIVVDRALTASHNTIVAVRVGEQFTVKRLLLYKSKTYEGKHVAASRFVKKNDFP